MKKSSISKSKLSITETAAQSFPKDRVVPYTGGAGPSKELAEHNTRVLGRELKKLGIQFEEDREYAKQYWDGDDLVLKLTRPTKSNVIGYAGYDRWGFVVEWIGRDDLDQESLEVTVKAIKEWYFGNTI